MLQWTGTQGGATTRGQFARPAQSQWNPDRFLAPPASPAAAGMPHMGGPWSPGEALVVVALVVAGVVLVGAERKQAPWPFRGAVRAVKAAT